MATRARFLPATLVLLCALGALVWFGVPSILATPERSLSARTTVPHINDPARKGPKGKAQTTIAPPQNGQEPNEEDGLAGSRQTPQGPGKTEDDKRPCHRGNDDRKSDLCAQWKAADSAFDAAGYAEWQTLLSLAGVIGLVLSLFFSAYATWAAGRGLRAASDALELGRSANAIALKEYRQAWKPTVVVTGMRLVPQWQSWFNRCNPIPLHITVENIGGSTARVVDVAIDYFLIRDRSGKTLYRVAIEQVLPPVHSHARHTAKLMFYPNRANLRELFEQGTGLGAHDVIVAGDVRSLNDDGQQIVEPFEWISDPYRRGGARLVENRPSGRRHSDSAHVKDERDRAPHDEHELFPQD